jgi:putative nucleotidyltransferase with HDIG domain
MPRRVVAYIGLVTMLAVLALLGVGAALPRVTDTHHSAAFALACFAVIAELMEYRLPAGAGGSVAIVPFVALGLLSPDWSAVVAVGAVTAVGQLAHRKALPKLIFNTAQSMLSIAVAVTAYVSIGAPTERAQFALTGESFAGAALMVFTFVSVNTVTVSGVIALTEGKSILGIWKENNLSTFAHSIFSVPFAFGLGWAYLQLGPLGAGIIALPLIGVRQLNITTVRLQKTNRELLELMVKAIEARDPYTSGHSRRVADAAAVIARAVGLRPREVERVRIAALLHDIGKIHSDFAEILQKEGKLTDAEWATMKTHPEKGAELVGTLSDLQDIVAPVRHHHEHWNGRGYPAGLSGEAIPLASRIITFADTIDALMTDRPYRRGKTAAEVREELLRCSGSQFDPSMCARILAPEVWSQLFADRPASGAHLTLLGRKRAHHQRVAS